MRELGLQAIAPGPNLSSRVQHQAIDPYLLRTITANHPNHIWGIAITSICLHHRWR